MTKEAVAWIVDRAWARPAAEVLAELGVQAELGLSAAEASKRLARHGPNQLRAAPRASAWAVFIRQFRSLVMALLAAAAAASFAFGDELDGLAILAVLLINALIGFAAELRAVRSMEALRKLGTVHARVLRAGRVSEVKAQALVPGDIVLLEAGDVITADLRLAEAFKLEADESVLTGESLPVGKTAEAVAEETLLADRANMLFKGTTLTRGAGRAVVVGTGMATELGRIAQLVEEAGEQATPLEQRLARLGSRLIGITLAIAAVVSGLGILSGKDALLMVETGIALAVAAIPEGLPIVATLALARGMLRLARRHALVNRLSAVETLGSTSVIFSDKTGTLTENRLTVRRVELEGAAYELSGEGLDIRGEFLREGRPVPPREDERLLAALENAVLCNNAALPDQAGAEARLADPLEVALLVAGAKAGLQRPDLAAERPEVREEAFDAATRMMATFHRREGGFQVAVKGAPEAVLAASDRLLAQDGVAALDEEARSRWQARNEELARQGLRVLAVAGKQVSVREAQPYEGLVFIGLLGLLDPPRSEVRAAIAACRRAGMRVIMVTGDHPATARAIALAVGITDDPAAAVMTGRELRPLEDLSPEQARVLRAASILARVDPKQKLDLIRLHQAAGAVVAMTGDGINDAPALKKADIGVAMGKRGTQVAREAADVVLKDDSFATIVVAVEQGRVLFRNLRKFVVYLLSCNVSEVIVVAIPAALGAPLPILPLQILFLNLVTDVFPALALGFGEGSRRELEHPPRAPDEAILGARHTRRVAGFGLIISAATLGAFFFALHGLEYELPTAVSVAFLTLAFAQLWHVFNMRDLRSRFFSNDITRNRWIWGALALCTLLLLAATWVPGLSRTLGVHDPGAAGWVLILAASLLPWVCGQLGFWWRARAQKPSAQR